MLASIVLTQLVAAHCTRALGVLLPLYFDPGANCAAWASVTDAISAHPTTQFYIIVNPNSGPGSNGSQPEEPYRTCISTLRPSTSQIVLGYVSTPAGNAFGDIDTYAGWNSSYRPTGIFLDGVSASINGVNTTQGYTSHVKAKGFNFTALDPGQTADSAYFGIADLVNTYEDSYSAFTAGSLSGTMSKQSVILVNAPPTGSYNAVISQLESLGVAAVYITNESDDSSDSPAQLSQFVDEVAGASGSSSSATKNASGTSSASASSAVNLPTSSSPGGFPTTASTATHKAPVGAIVGGVLGGLIIVLGISAVILCVRRRRKPEVPVVPFMSLEAARGPLDPHPAPSDAPSSGPHFPDSNAGWNPGAASASTSIPSATSPRSTFLRDPKAPQAGPSIEAPQPPSSTYGTEWSQQDSAGPPPAYSD